MAHAGNDVTANYLGGVKIAIDPAKANAITATDFGKFQSVASLRTALAGYGYTAAQLDIMSKNDMVFALRTKLGLV